MQKEEAEGERARLPFGLAARAETRRTGSVSPAGLCILAMEAMVLLQLVLFVDLL